jgi:hypothetical protein
MRAGLVPARKAGDCGPQDGHKAARTKANVFADPASSKLKEVHCVGAGLVPARTAGAAARRAATRAARRRRMSLQTLQFS